MGEGPKKKRKRVSRVTGNFNRTARDLSRALRVARFGEAEGYLVGEAMELSYSFARDGEARAFQFNLSSIERMSGLNRSNLSRTCQNLVDRAVFLGQNDGMLRFNKVYPGWYGPDDHCVPKGHTTRTDPNNRLFLLSVEQIEWCLQVASIEADCCAGATPPYTRIARGEFSYRVFRVSRARSFGRD